MNSASITEPDKLKVVQDRREFSAGEFAEMLNIHRTSVLRRAEKEQWSFRDVDGNGGVRRLYALATLPLDDQRKVRIHIGELPAEIADGIPTNWDQDRIARCAKLWDSAEDWQQQWAKSRVDILAALNAFRGAANLGKRAATDRFAYLYNQRQAPGVDPALYETVRRLSKSQLYEWER